MVVIELRSPRYDPGTRAVSRDLVARIAVDASEGLRVIEGDEEWVHIVDIVVNHPQTKKDLTYTENPELWAMTVPEAFRSDIVAAAYQVTAITGEPAPERASFAGGQSPSVR